MFEIKYLCFWRNSTIFTMPVWRIMQVLGMITKLQLKEFAMRNGKLRFRLSAEGKNALHEGVDLNGEFYRIHPM